MTWERLSVFLALLGLVFAVPPVKINSKLQSVLASQSSTNIFISMKEGTEKVLASLSSIKFDSRETRLNTVADSLRYHARQSQNNILMFLEERNIEHRSFWVDNSIFIKNANWELVKILSTFLEIEEIYEENTMKLEKPKISENSAPRVTQWGVEKIGADRVWALPGNTNGTGIVVATVDTGVRYTHEALRASYRGDYGWLDPLRHTDYPSDQNGHGTHTMGIIVGAGGIGVAPGAKWMTCLGCNAGCSQYQYMACGQFITCPTDPQENNPDCSKAPNVVSNSWGGGQAQTWFDGVINTWIAAGIVPVFSLGNSGPNCDTSLSPGDSESVIGVGSTTETDGLSPWSSKGPNMRGNIKPDICAPGSNIYSSYHVNDTRYQTMSGTSMSSPMVAGAIALILGVRPNSTIPEVKDILFNHASRNVTTNGESCGGIGENEFPNNVFGHGRIDVFKSVQSLFTQQ